MERNKSDVWKEWRYSKACRDVSEEEVFGDVWKELWRCLEGREMLGRKRDVL